MVYNRCMRIASLSPATTEILFALEQQRKILCVDRYSDYPEAAKALPRLNEHQKINTEELKKFAPEIVFTATLVQQKLAEKLKSEGFGIIHQDPRSINEIYAAIREIGIILDCTARADALIATLQQGFNDTKRKSGLLMKRPRVYVEEWHNPPMVSGNWVPELVRLAGGIPFDIRSGGQESGIKNQELRDFKNNNAPRAGLLTRGDSASGDSTNGKNPPSREVSLQEIQKFDPDLIVLSICGAGAIANKELLTNRIGWSDLRAVKENHLFVIDDSLLNRPGPRLVEGAKRLFGWVFQVLH